MTDAWINAIGIVAAAAITGVFAFLAGARGEGTLVEMRRRKMYKLRGKLQHVCPHVVLNESGVESLIVVAKYSLDYCKTCYREFRVEDTKENFLYWQSLAAQKTNNALPRRTKKADRLVQKLDRLGNWKLTVPQ